MWKSILISLATAAVGGVAQVFSTGAPITGRNAIAGAVAGAAIGLGALHLKPPVYGASK